MKTKYPLKEVTEFVVKGSDWTSSNKRPMIMARASFGIFNYAAKKQIYVAGGYNQEETTSQCECYDMEKD